MSHYIRTINYTISSEEFVFICDALGISDEELKNYTDWEIATIIDKFINKALGVINR